MPELSILMPVYNSGRYVIECLKSLQCQTLSSWELIVINDGSSDNSIKLIKEFGLGNKIKILNNKSRKGIAYSLNRGIKHARGELVARMDADDLCEPDRLERQTSIFKSNPSLILCGSNARIIDSNGIVIAKTNMPCSYHEIQALNLICNCFIHPSVMFRGRWLKNINQPYDESYSTTQDWALWNSAIVSGPCLNLQEPLIRYREHPNSVSAKKRKEQIFNSLRVQRRYMEMLSLTQYWNEEIFRENNTYFLDERDKAFKDKKDISHVCGRILRHFFRFFSTNPGFWKPAYIFCIKRALILTYPVAWKASQIDLLCFLIQHPLKSLFAIYSLVYEKNSK
jgi:glycosyltransferase involved in cell wall biosynthesis